MKIVKRNRIIVLVILPLVTLFTMCTKQDELKMTIEKVHGCPISGYSYNNMTYLTDSVGYLFAYKIENKKRYCSYIFQTIDGGATWSPIDSINRIMIIDDNDRRPCIIGNTIYLEGRTEDDFYQLNLMQFNMETQKYKLSPLQLSSNSFPLKYTNNKIAVFDIETNILSILNDSLSIEKNVQLETRITPNFISVNKIQYCLYKNKLFNIEEKKFINYTKRNVQFLDMVVAADQRTIILVGNDEDNQFLYVIAYDIQTNEFSQLYESKKYSFYRKMDINKYGKIIVLISTPPATIFGTVETKLLYSINDIHSWKLADLKKSSNIFHAYFYENTLFLFCQEWGHIYNQKVLFKEDIPDSIAPKIRQNNISN